MVPGRVWDFFSGEHPFWRWDAAGLGMGAWSQTHPLPLQLMVGANPAHPSGMRLCHLLRFVTRKCPGHSHGEFHICSI